MEEKIIQKEKKKINFKLIFFIIFLVVTIGAILNSVDKIESGKVWYFLDNTSTGFLGTNKKSSNKYYQINTYDEYMEMYDSIGQWSKKISKDATELEIIVNLIRQSFISGGYTESFFEKYTLLLVENFTYGTVPLEQEIENIYVKDNILTVQLNTMQEENIDRGKCILHLIAVPQKKLKDVNKIEIDVHN